MGGRWIVRTGSKKTRVLVRPVRLAAFFFFISPSVTLSVTVTFSVNSCELVRPLCEEEESEPPNMSELPNMSESL